MPEPDNYCDYCGEPFADDDLHRTDSGGNCCCQECAMEFESELFGDRMNALEGMWVCDYPD